MKSVEDLVDRVSSWAGVSVHPHRFGGREFQFGKAEFGHVHAGGIVDVPFPRAIRDALLEEHLAEQHHWVPDSGWISFRVRHEDDLGHALWLLRLSYVRYALKARADRNLLEAEAQQLGLSPRFKSLLESFVPRPVNKTAPQQASG